MEHTEKIKALIEPLLLEQELKLYEMNWRKEGKTSVLQIAIMRMDGSMDIDTCALVSEQISQRLDQADLIAHEYFLEVCSPGAERELRSEVEIAHAIGEYVYIKYRDPKAGRNEIYGILEAIEEERLHISYMDKNIQRKTDVNKDNIALIRLAVKL